jgi:hypothetical protein
MGPFILNWWPGENADAPKPAPGPPRASAAEDVTNANPAIAVIANTFLIAHLFLLQLPNVTAVSM